MLEFISYSTTPIPEVASQVVNYLLLYIQKNDLFMFKSIWIISLHYCFNRNCRVEETGCEGVFLKMWFYNRVYLIGMNNVLTNFTGPAAFKVVTKIKLFTTSSRLYRCIPSKKNNVFDVIYKLQINQQSKTLTSFCLFRIIQLHRIDLHATKKLVKKRLIGYRTNQFERKKLRVLKVKIQSDVFLGKFKTLLCLLCQHLSTIMTQMTLIWFTKKLDSKENKWKLYVYRKKHS